MLTKSFWLLGLITAIGSFVLARAIQFFAMGWRWKITQQQIDRGFNKRTKRKEFWITFSFFFLLITAFLLYFGTRSA
jgi:uncharacterized membrane protein YidH (DUF202 family)